MDKHALAVLGVAGSWWPITRRALGPGGKFRTYTARLLFYLIIESQALGGTVLKQFWDQLRLCDVRLGENGVSRQSFDFPPKMNSVRS
jgi:hypothetical protein